MNARERWKRVREVGDGRSIEVSSRGRLRDRTTRRPLEPTRMRNGFLVVRARHNGRRHSVTLHRLVAASFLPGTPTYPVLFVNGVRSDCSVTNLRWATIADKRIPFRKLTDVQVRAIRARAGLVNQRTMASQFGVCPQQISEIVSRKIWIGPQWEPAVDDVAEARKEATENTHISG